ncbi:type III secretion protein D [Paraburkholderia sp. WSM4175]|uniref:HrpD5 family protein n=1 Tax=Paraburkholderia sp. WSM4175 TaxID=2991072 RepID=UPI003D1D63A4
MKALRVLTGLHAGAQISVAPGSYCIGGADDADICISDWQVEPITLTLGEDGVTRLYSVHGDEVLVADFVAVPFGDVVFCLGPQDGAWPSDLELLAGLWKTAALAAEGTASEAQPEPEPAAEPALHAADAGVADPATATHAAERNEPADAKRAPRPAQGRRNWRTAAIALGCAGAIAGLAAAGAMLTAAQPSEAANRPVNSDLLATELGSALQRAGFADLQVAARRDGVAVKGIVANADDSARARRIMDQLARGNVRREYDVAQQDVDDIQQSLADTGAHVSYDGHGVFRVSGSVHAMDAFRDRIASVRADLDDNVKRIDIDVKEARMPASDVEYTEVVATGGLRYIETPDGTKHLFAGAAADRGND